MQGAAWVRAPGDWRGMEWRGVAAALPAVWGWQGAGALQVAVVPRRYERRCPVWPSVGGHMGGHRFGRTRRSAIQSTSLKPTLPILPKHSACPMVVIDGVFLSQSNLKVPQQASNRT